MEQIDTEGKEPPHTVGRKKDEAELGLQREHS